MIRTSLMFQIWSTQQDESGFGTVVFQFNPVDPFVVTLVFADDHEWTFDRHLLEQGIQRPAGIGDVRVWPFGAKLALVLNSPDGRGLLLFDAVKVERFVNDITARVPTPRMDVDALIDEIRREST